MVKKILAKKFSFIVLGLLILAGGFLLLRNRQKPELDFTVVKRGDIVQELSFTGKVKPAEAVELAFEKSGRVSIVYVDVGNKVFAGQILAGLDNNDVSASLKQAQANLETELLRLEEIKAGSREEEIKIQEAKVESAQVAKKEAEKNLIDKIGSSYTVADDSIRNKVDQFFSDPRSLTPKLNLFPVESQLKTDLESSRLTMENLLKDWQTAILELTNNPDLNLYSNQVKANLEQTKLFLDKAALAVNSMIANASFSQTTIDGYKTDISTARTNINTAINSLSSAQEKLNTAITNLNLANQELALKKAGATPEQIKIQGAKIDQARANLESARAEYSKTILKSPIAGIITKKQVSPGEIVSLNQVAFSVISDSGLEIETNIPEVDIAKIKVNDQAKVDLDAYGPSLILEAKVIRIDPAETIIEGVATYNTKLTFKDPEQKAKPGMTANINLSHLVRENVLTISRKAIVLEEDKEFVNLITEKGIEQREVKTGVRSSNGEVELVSGLSEGDKVLLPK
ncbi:MAG: efflux RND transporter periplasmic adaptor subunit [Patescibacteria group bacterium]